jgi:glycerol kinase
MKQHLLALDQGTTGSTALLLTRDLHVVAKANVEFPQIFPQPGWVEHDPEAIWQSQVAAVAAVMQQAGVDPASIGAVGITNQRETTTIWHRASGKPIHNAIVWQCRRTAPACDALVQAGKADWIRARTGLAADAYFSGTKAAWLLDHVAGAREQAERGELAFGTVDTWLVWRLTGGQAHVTDPSNASRTMLYDLDAHGWSDDLCQLLRVPRAILPTIQPSAHVYGHTLGVPGLPDGIPIAGAAGDQQAALCGQLCLQPGEAKCTYGTGAFLLMQTGSERIASRHGLLTTVAWQVGDEVCYALEGSVFIAGAAVQWLRDGLRVIGKASEIEALARSVSDSGGVVFVPALAGLGAPHWRPDARGAITGITRGTTTAHLARATLEGIAHSCADLLDAMAKDLGRNLRELRVDGGAAANDLLMQLQADLVQATVVRPEVIETTALGAAILAGVGVGWFGSLEQAGAAWREERRFQPGAPVAIVAARDRWRRAVDAV